MEKTAREILTTEWAGKTVAITDREPECVPVQNMTAASAIVASWDRRGAKTIDKPWRCYRDEADNVTGMKLERGKGDYIKYDVFG